MSNKQTESFNESRHEALEESKSKVKGKMKKSHLGKLLEKPEYKKANKKFNIKGYEDMMK